MRPVGHPEVPGAHSQHHLWSQGSEEAGPEEDGGSASGASFLLLMGTDSASAVGSGTEAEPRKTKVSETT